jgi:hypothetical protein
VDPALGIPSAGFFYPWPKEARMSASRDLHPETRLVHASPVRSQFGEVSEADVLTQGFACGSARQGEACFNGTKAATDIPASRTRR